MSTGKEFKTIIDGYNSSVLSQEKTNKAFSFYEFISLENLDAESKKEIIFGKKITDFFEKTNLERIQQKTAFSVHTPVIAKNEKEQEATPNFDGLPKKNTRVVTNIGKDKIQGQLKIFYEKDDFGFIKIDKDRDVFVHMEDLKKAGITKEFLRENKNPRFAFTLMEYLGRHNISKKAINIELLQN